MSDDPRDDAEFGPSGYLPERAARRARKIVLRAPLGVQWIVAAAVFGLVVIVAGVLFLTRSGPPGPPWVAVGTLQEIGDAQAVPEVDTLVVTAGGPVLAFAHAETLGLSWCPDTRHITGTGGRVWSVTGRGYGTESLTRHPVLVHDGTVYVDPTTTAPGPRAADDTEVSAC